MGAVPDRLGRATAAESPSHGSTSWRSDIQGLRAVAVLLVVLGHFFALPSGGYIGVDVFFVISGYLITGILMRGEQRLGRVSISAFYGQRARRILPAALTVLIATSATALVLWPQARATQTFLDALAAAFFVENWHLVVIGTDYLQGAGAVSPVQHYWSLAVEEQFYVVWPLVLMVLLRLTRGPRATSRRPVLLVAIAAMGLISLGFAALLQARTPSAAYFDSIGRGWELLAGAMVAVVAGNGSGATGRTVRRFVGPTSLVAIGAAAFALSASSSFPFPWAVIPVAATAALLWAPHPSGWVGRGLALAPMQFLGRISYSLYLWHFPVGIVGSTVWGDSIAVEAALLAVSVLLATASEQWIERPFREHRTSPRSVRVDLVIVAAVGALILTMAAAQFKGPGVVRSGTAALSAVGRLPETRTYPEGQEPDLATVQSLVAEASVARSWPEGMRLTLDEMSSAQGPPQLALGPDGCRNDVDRTDAPRTCVAGSDSAPRHAALVGDSVAVSWAPTVERALAPKGYQVTTFGYASCPLVEVDVNERIADPDFPGQCRAARARTMKQLEAMDPDLVIVSSSEGSLLYLTSGATGEDARDEWAEGTSRMVQRLSGLGAPVVVLGAPPRATEPGTCVTAVSGPDRCLADQSDLTSITADGAKAGVQKAGRPGVTYVDVRPWFCTSRGQCPAFIGDTFLRTDSTHLTLRGAQLYANVFAEALPEIP